MNPIKLRPATTADLAAVRTVRERAIRGLARGHLEAGAVEAVVKALADGGDGPRDGHLVVAVMGNRIVGSAAWSLEPPAFARAIAGVVIHGDPVPTVTTMYVDPVCAGRGLGRRLLDHVEAAIAAAGWRRAVLTASPMGLGFYERCGWRRLATMELQVDGHAVPSHAMDKLIVPDPLALPRATNPAVRAGARAA